jgi:hypothetical protein
MRYNRTCVLPTIQRGQMALEGFELFGDLYDVGALPPALSWATWGAFVGHLRGARVDVAECALGRERVGARERAAARRVVRFHAGAATFSVPEGCNLPMSTFAANASARTANLAALDAALARAPADVVLLHHQDFFQPIPLARAAGHALRIAPAVFERAAALRREIGPYIVLRESRFALAAAAAEEERLEGQEVPARVGGETQSINQSTNQPINRSTDQPINRSTH